MGANVGGHKVIVGCIYCNNNYVPEETIAVVTVLCTVTRGDGVMALV